MAKQLPRLEEREINVSVLEQLKKEDGSRLYSDIDIAALSDDEVKEITRGAKQEFYKESLRGQNKTARDRISGKAPWDTQPPLTQKQIDDLNESIFSPKDLRDASQELVDDEPEGIPEPDTSKQDAGEEGAGKGPTPEIQLKQREPKGPPEAILELVRPQIDPTVASKTVKQPDGTEKTFGFVPPSLTPIGSLDMLDMFVEPVSRKVFVVVYNNPTGFFYACTNIPCGYPLILPLPYPVSLIGPAPAGAIALPFINPDLPDCFGTEPYDLSVYLEDIPAPDVSALAAPITPCDPDLEPNQMRACQEALRQQARNILGELPIPENLRQLLALIQERSVIPVETPQPVKAPKPREQIRIFTEDGLDDIDFKLDLQR